MEEATVLDTMPFHGVWKRTILYEPIGTLASDFEQTLNVLWVQAKSGIYIDLRTPAVGERQKDKKSFAGTSAFNTSTTHLNWTRVIDYRAIPSQDIGAVSINSEGQLVEDGVLPGDDYREIWVKQTRTADRDNCNNNSDYNNNGDDNYDNNIHTNTNFSNTLQPVITNTCNEVSCVLRCTTASNKTNIVGYFVVIDGYFALTLNLRDVASDIINDTIDITDNTPTVEELRRYFNNSVADEQAPSTIVENVTQIECYLSKYVTIIGDAHSWIIVHSLDTSLLDMNIVDAHIVTLPLHNSHESSASNTNNTSNTPTKLSSIMQEMEWEIVSGELPFVITNMIQK